ncbi:transcriptional repressor CTCF-like isoform X9 [Pieris napi]|uniref:transcriptional repressor CTCF-like isoform X9 n=1 Tax=Pieris napi TaxID=78633 RepID=UPI001FBB27F5|nr:transcriptional repressor CTCF-like isoform X9 [Pieris napi]
MEGKVWRPGPTVCRCCLSEGCYKDISTEYFWMGKKEVYADMLSDTFDLSIQYAPTGGPNSQSRLICEPCISRLRDATDFKRQIKECEQTFMEYLNPRTTVDIEIPVELPEKEVKTVTVKVEKPLSDDDDFGDTELLDDDDDDLDDEPLMNLASKVPKKESVDVTDLIDNAKAEKRKSTTKPKATPKKAKVKEAKPSVSKAKPEKKKKGSPIADTRAKGRKLKEHVSARQMLRRRRANNELPEESERRIAKTMMQRNAIALLECSTAWAFRWFRCAYYCSYCDIKFLEPNDLRDHIRSNHLHQQPTKKLFAKLTENNMLKVEISDLKCRLCGLNFNTIDVFKEHLVLVHQKKLYPNYSDGVLPFKLSSNDFKCPKCNIRFASFSKMNEHMNSHFRNYICDTCGKGFVSKSRFRAHVQSHEVGSFPCGVCDEVLETRTARMCHRVKVHLKGVKYACPRCPEVFTKYNARLKHLVEKHGQQKIYYPCVHCGKLFETSCNRSAHYRMSHKVGKKCSDLNNSWNDKRADSL